MFNSHYYLVQVHLHGKVIELASPSIRLGTVSSDDCGSRNSLRAMGQKFTLLHKTESKTNHANLTHRRNSSTGGRCVRASGIEVARAIVI